MLQVIHKFFLSIFSKLFKNLYVIPAPLVLPIPKISIPQAESVVDVLINPSDLRRIKREVFESSLEKGVTSLHLDATVQGTRVPEHLSGQRNLVLNYSYRYQIPDFDFNDEGVIASLSFKGVQFQCVVPWDAVFGIGNHVDSNFYSFVEAAPKEKMAEDEPEKDATERRKGFKLIKGGKE